jgi:hypothetical protein
MKHQQCLYNPFRQLIIALLVIWTIITAVSCFTDTYRASDDRLHVVLLIPFYGPQCFNLPSDFDKDRVYEFYYVKVGS